MAITQVYISMDEMFRYTDGDKVIINHLSYIDSNDMEFIQSKLTTVYSGDTISTIPCCDCGHTKGRYLVGMECPECSTVCIDPKDRTKPVLWFESLDPSIPFISPAFWNSLSRLLSRKADLLRWLSDPHYQPQVVIPNYILLAKEEVLGGTRGYQEMVSNFDKLLDYFVNSTELKSKPAYKEIVMLRDIFLRKQDDILSSYLPVLNKKLFVVENTTKGTYVNLVLGDVIDAITLWLKASKDDVTLRRKATATSMLISKLAELYIKYYEKFLLGKPGGFRKHIYGGRSHFTYRTVISAAKGKHKHNEVIPPWLVSLTTYRPHVLNKLIRRGYSYKQADKLINSSISAYSPVIAEIQQELINESPYPQGLPILENRNQLLGFLAIEI